MLQAVRGGPIRSPGARCRRDARDPARSQVVLVTLPETTPVNELIETAYALEDDGGVHLGPVVVNAFDDGDDLAARPRRSGHARCAPPPSSATPAATSTDGVRTPARRAGPRARADPPAAGAGAGARSRTRSSSWRRASTDPCAQLSLRDDRRLIADADVVVCCGSGGVGKTTTAAALGLQAARARAALRGRHDRPGQAPGRRARRARRADQRSDAAARSTGHGRAVGADARHGDARSTGWSRRTRPTPSRPSGS